MQLRVLVFDCFISAVGTRLQFVLTSANTPASMVRELLVLTSRGKE